MEITSTSLSVNGGVANLSISIQAKGLDMAEAAQLQLHILKSLHESAHPHPPFNTKAVSAYAKELEDTKVEGPAPVPAWTPPPDVPLEGVNPETANDPPEDDPPVLPEENLGTVMQTGKHEGQRVVELVDRPDFTFAKRLDGTVIKFSTPTGQEIARKAPDLPASAPIPTTMPEATPAKRPGRDPDVDRIAFAEQAGVPKSVHEADTLRGALIAAVKEVGREGAVAFIVNNAAHIPACKGADGEPMPGDKLAERASRVLITLPVEGA